MKITSFIAGVIFFLFGPVCVFNPQVTYAGELETSAKAEALMREVDAGNKGDLDFLWNLLEPFCDGVTSKMVICRAGYMKLGWAVVRWIGAGAASETN